MVWEFGQALRHIPQLFRTLAFKTRTLEEQLHQSMLSGNLKRAFSLFDLIMVGIGITVGSGVFLLTGTAQALYSGSGTFLGYLIMGIPLLCAAACYAELSVEYPVSGSAFTYVLTTLGELPAFITLGFLFFEYTLSAAAVSRAFSEFFALLCNQPFGLGYVYTGNSDIVLDFIAMAISIALTGALCFGIKESSLFLTAANISGLFFLLFIAIAGFSKASGEVFASSFLPRGSDGLFQAFAVLTFSYVGFDAICNAVEEARKVEDVPKAILSTIGINAFVYALLALALGFMVTSQQLLQCISPDYEIIGQYPCEKPSVPAFTSAYVFAFITRGLPWIQYIIAIGALFTTTTTLLVDLYSAARLVMVGAREWLLPPQLASISARTQTPLVAQLFCGLVVSVVALLFPYAKLSQIVSFGSLIVISVVCNAYLGRRYYPDVKLRYTQYGGVEAKPRMQKIDKFRVHMSKKTHRLVVWVHLIIINVLSFACGIFYRASGYGTSYIISDGNSSTTIDTTSKNSHYSYWFILGWFIATCSMWYFCKLEYYPESWRIPHFLLPFLPSFAIFVISFTSIQLNIYVYWYFLVFVGAFCLIYVFFSMPLSYIRRFHGSREEDDARVVELVFRDGRWLTMDEVMSPITSGPAISGSPRSDGRSTIASIFPWSILSNEKQSSVTSDSTGKCGIGGPESP